MKSALLLSGGMDSLALAWWKHPDLAFTVDYGQLAAEGEIAAATAICKRLDLPHQVLRIDCRTLGSGDMAGAEADTCAPASDWWPYRNQLLVTLVAMRAISLGITELWIGTVRSDSSHRDGTQEFVDSLSALMFCQEGRIQVHAPAMDLTTTELVLRSGISSDCLAWAHSCHKANVACGHCRGCNKYFEVFHELGYDLDRSR